MADVCRRVFVRRGFGEWCNGGFVTGAMKLNVRIIAPGVDIAAELTPEQIDRLVEFALNLCSEEKPATQPTEK